MWFLAMLWASCLLMGTHAQGSASFRRANAGSGRCQYTFMVDSPTEASCPSAGSSPEMEALKSRLGLLEALVARLVGGEAMSEASQGSGSQSGLQDAYNQVMGENAQLQREKQRLDRQVQDLQQRLEELRQEAERLRSRTCMQQPPPRVPQNDNSFRPGSGPALSHLVSRPGNTQGDKSSLRDPAWHHENPGYQELTAVVTEVSAPNLEGPADISGCGDLVWVQEPEVHRKADSIAGKYGVWMQDPEAKEPYGPEMVWRIDAVGSEVRQLFGYENMDQLSRGFPTKVLLLPESMESTGATMYRGSLYYQRRLSRTLLRYDLLSESIAARRDLLHAGFHGQFPYSWGGYTDIDLALDENGLWAIYSTNKAKGAIVISQLDPHNLEVKGTWETKIRKTSVANAFMICGKLYTVASYTSPNTTINYMYDTATSQGKIISVPFKNRYRYNSMVDYNPAQRKLYAWDSFYMVSYNVRLGKQE
ncbi:myocilin [Sinocyclocheilus anshuiensis]|uniref:Myocilin n=1 Tax=Sinocyclocheilus anshuiensis TaxID=1608454 RepID=A0A671QCA4_9TELE|nr:PREDICTED: myocilin-like [Sinocyclocheilus anshuiensis]